jgi:glycosyltransferase involved in cell wall biosynthesis
MDVTVVIPAYNEAATITAVVRRACRFADRVIVVDDGSDDGTSERIRELSVTLLRHTHNQGKAASLWYGMTVAVEQGASAVVTMDADGQHRPEDSPRLVAVSRQYPRKIIIAARLIRRAQMPALRRFANGVAVFWISWAAGYPIQDTHSGFRLYPAEILKTVTVAHGPRRGFIFESEILIEAVRSGYDPVTVPIDAIYYPKARASYYRPWIDTIRIVRMVAWKLISRGLYFQGLLRVIGLLPCHTLDFSAPRPAIRRKREN